MFWNLVAITNSRFSQLFWPVFFFVRFLFLGSCRAFFGPLLPERGNVAPAVATVASLADISLQGTGRLIGYKAGCLGNLVFKIPLETKPNDIYIYI